MRETPENRAAAEEALRKLLCLVAAENPVFHLHVLETVQDALENRDTHAAAMELLHKSFTPEALEAFIAGVPPVQDSLPESGPLHQLLLLAHGSGSVHAADIAALVAGELLHRKAWDEAIARYPDTFEILKERLSS